jgi:hypothetical protein
MAVKDRPKDGAVTPFEIYFERHFGTSLNNVGDEAVFANGGKISDASWDRKAAYLLWCELGRPGDKPIDDDDWDIL